MKRVTGEYIETKGAELQLKGLKREFQLLGMG